MCGHISWGLARCLLFGCRNWDVRVTAPDLPLLLWVARGDPNGRLPLRGVRMILLAVLASGWPPPQAAVAGRQRRTGLYSVVHGDLSLQGVRRGSHCSTERATNQCAGGYATVTEARPQAGVESATTADGKRAITPGDESQDVGLPIAGRCVHDAKPNRIRPGRSLAQNPPGQAVHFSNGATCSS